jgi:hypothetical protein
MIIKPCFGTLAAGSLTVRYQSEGYGRLTIHGAIRIKLNADPD